MGAYPPYGFAPPPGFGDPNAYRHLLPPPVNPAVLAWREKYNITDGPAMGGPSYTSGPPARLAEPLIPHPKTPKGLPPSSEDLQLQLKEVEALVDVYGTLRGFSFTLRLSPFTLVELSREIFNQVCIASPQSCLCPQTRLQPCPSVGVAAGMGYLLPLLTLHRSQRTSALIDEVAVQLLRAIQSSPPVVSEEAEGIILHKDEIDGQYFVREQVCCSPAFPCNFDRFRP